MTPPVQSGPHTATPGPGQLFLAFAVIGLSGFGGVLPIVRDALVERRRWLTPQEFVELLSLCQIVPGANVVNLAISYGTRVGGVTGAAAAYLGLLSGPVTIVLLLAALYDRISDLPQTAQTFQAVASAAAGLISAMALKLARPLLGAPMAMAVAAAVFVAMVVLHLPLLGIIAVMAPAGVALAWARKL